MRGRSADMKIVFLLVAFILLLPAAARADFPEKPMQVLVGWPAGSQNDMIDRAIAHSLQKILKQPVIIQNMPGASGTLILGRAKIEKPDGYTLFQTSVGGYARHPHLRSVPYQIKDFAYLAQHARFQYGLYIRADSPWKNFDELIAYVKKNPNKVRYSTSGVGGSMHLSMECITLRDKLQWIHVPFTGGTESLAALLGGHVEVYSAAIGTEVEQVRSGRLRFILSTNPNRSPLFPDVPSILEKGYDFAVMGGACWTVPAATPKEIQLKLEKALLESFKDPIVIDVITKWSMVMEPIGGEALEKMIIEDYRRHGELFKQFGLGIYKKK